MCSIGGMIDYQNRPDIQLVNRMGMTMKNRGLDATECYGDDIAVLHHNRVSVMDPENGRQPMTASDGERCTLVHPFAGWARFLCHDRTERSGSRMLDSRGKCKRFSGASGH